MKTEQIGVSAVNRQIFSLNNAAKKLYQIITFFLLSFICSSVYAGSNSGSNPTLKTISTSVKIPNLTSSAGDYENLLTYPSDLASTSLSWYHQGGMTGGQTLGYGVSVDSDGSSYLTGYTNVGLFGQIQNGTTDYYIIKYDATGDLVWNKQVGASAGYTYGYGTSTDESGNIYVTGYTTVGLNGQTQKGIYDYFIAKYDKLGNLKWLKQFGTHGVYTSVYGVKADESGNIYVVGTTAQGSSALRYCFIAKHDADGNQIWAKQTSMYTSGVTSGYGVSTDTSGNVYVTGNAYDNSQGANRYGYFIIRYDPDGNFIWSIVNAGASGTITKAYGISVDTVNNIYITGYTNGALSNQKLNGIYNYFVAKYDTRGGQLSWLKEVGAPGGYTYGFGVSTDNTSSNVYVTGFTNVALGAQNQNGNRDYFVAKYDAFGNPKGTVQIGAANGDTEGYGIAVDSLNNVYVTGFTNKGISDNTQTGKYDYFVAKNPS